MSDDDGRTVADMNIDGMPWYKKPAQGTPAGYTPQGAREWIGTILGALGAGLLAALVFVGLGALFILFCTKVWLG